MTQEQATLSGLEPETFVLARPRIEFHPKVLEASVPYEVSVDSERIARFLHDVGMSDSQIQKTRVNVRRVALINPFKIFGGEVGGSYNPFSDNITIYTDWAWKIYQRRMGIAKRMTQGREKLWPLNRGDEGFLNRGVHTKKLPNYLRNLDPERSLPFAEGMLIAASNKSLDGVFIHEAKHKLDWITASKLPVALASTGLKMGIIYGTAMAFSHTVGEHITPTHIGAVDSVVQQLATLAALGTATFVEYEVDPLEIRARNFDKEHSHKSKYHPLVTITPKS